MSMKIAVCVKSVPDVEYQDKVIIDPVTKTFDRSAIPSAINSADKHALELAFSIRENYGGEITAVSMGPVGAKEQLYEALAMGADRGVLLSDEKLAGADTLATSYALSVLLKNLDDFDLVLAGNESDDGGTAHVPIQLGEWLEIAHVIHVTKVDVEDGKNLTVHKEVEGGTGIYKCSTPCLIAVKKKINTVRYTTVEGVMSAKNKPLIEWCVDDLKGIDEKYIGYKGSPTKSGDLRIVDRTRKSQALVGSADEIARRILDKINRLTNTKWGVKYEK